MKEKKILRAGETKAPIITHAFAVDKGYYGYIWEIYIEAEDPDADMERIAVVVNQVGYGRKGRPFLPPPLLSSLSSKKNRFPYRIGPLDLSVPNIFSITFQLVLAFSISTGPQYYGPCTYVPF